MDIPTQLAIKQADIPHLSKLVEDAELNEYSGSQKIPYLIGKVKAHMEMYKEMIDRVLKLQYGKKFTDTMLTITAQTASKSVPAVVRELSARDLWKEEVEKAYKAVKFWEAKLINESKLKDVQDYNAKRKALQDIQNDPKIDSQMKTAVMVRKQKLDKELQDLKARTSIAAEVEPGTEIKEDDDSAFAIGISKAKEIKKDYGSPLKKSTIVKGHEIAKAIKKDEHVGAKATFERLWTGHKKGDK